MVCNGVRLALELVLCNSDTRNLSTKLCRTVQRRNVMLCKLGLFGRFWLIGEVFDNPRKVFVFVNKACVVT